jgi:ribose transport system substrate-binding protein
MTKQRSIIIGAVGLLVLASACSSSNTPTSTSSAGITRTQVPDSAFKPTDLEATVNNLVEQINNSPAKTMQLGVVLKDLKPYFQPVVTGANRAISELKAVGGVVAPADNTDADAAKADEIGMIGNYVAGGYDGIGVAPFDETTVPAIDAAADEGIPVVTLDSDAANSKRQVYVGTINAAAGTTAGQTLASLLAPIVSGTVIILGHDDPGWTDGYNRTMAAKQALEGTGFTVNVLKTDWEPVAGQANDLAALATLIQDANPPVVGMMGMFSDAYRCAMAAEAAGMAAGDVKIAAFDFDANTVNYMRSGYIQATHAQRQYYMGYVVPYILYGINALGLDQTKAILQNQMVDATSFNTGLDVVPASNLDGYYSFLDSLGAGSQ